MMAKASFLESRDFLLAKRAELVQLLVVIERDKHHCRCCFRNEWNNQRNELLVLSAPR